MANKRYKAPVGEDFKPLRQAEYVIGTSSIDPLPYFPGLARALRGPTNAMVLTYLEMLHPAPQDANGDPTNEPVTIDCDQACEDIQVSRRTLHVALRCLSTWFLTEHMRSRAERAGRAFINEFHSLYPNIKAYSVVGPKVSSQPHVRLSLKRNVPRLNALFQIAGVAFLQSPSALTLSINIPAPVIIGVSAYRSPVLSLPSLLQSIMPDWGDRRRERWDRWRRENGRKPTNLSRMRDGKIGVGSLDLSVGDVIKEDTTQE
jgi:hypothetical protein